VPAMRVAWCLRGVLAASVLVAWSGCDRPPSSDGLREWTAQDHDRAEENAKVSAGQQASAQPARSPADQTRTLVEMTWRNQCAACHGTFGKGDGPNGPMVKAADLTSEEWQAKVTDEELALSIRNGKGKMPKFELPVPVVLGLIGRIRAARGH
jgi:mono/diheme cytochrome c family protein